MKSGGEKGGKSFSCLTGAAAVEVGWGVGIGVGLLAVGVAPGFEAFDDDPDFEDDGGDGEGAEEVVGFGAGEPSGFALEEIKTHRDPGEDEHEDGGRDDEPDWGFFQAEPKEDNEEGEASEELVGGSKKRPKEEAAFAEIGEFPSGSRCWHSGDDSSDNDCKDGGEMFVGEGLDFELNGELLGDVALEAAGGVEGGGGEGGDEDTHNGHGEGGGEAEGFQEVGGSVDEGSYFGRESSGAAPRCVASLVGVFACEEDSGFDAVDDLGDAESESSDAGENDDGGEEALSEHGAVANKVGIGFVFELLGGGS